MPRPLQYVKYVHGFCLGATLEQTNEMVLVGGRIAT